MSKAKRTYNGMEEVLQNINKKCIALSEEEVRRNNEILHVVLDLIIGRMRENDNLFDEIFGEVFYGGSYYDDLKISRPNEYDVDLLLILPDAIVYELRISDIPGFVHLKFLNYVPSLRNYRNPYISSYRKLRSPPPKFRGFQKLLTNDDFLDTRKVLQWMERVVQRALNTFGNTRGKRILRTECGTFFIRMKTSGPAFTLQVEGPNNEYLDIDLVPCFLFGDNHWPAGEFRQNPVPDEKEHFFIVPKQPKGIPHSNCYWRLSFQEQERIIIKDMAALKPTIRLLKEHFFIVPKQPKGIPHSNCYWRLSFQEQERIIIKDMAALKPTIRLLKKMRDRFKHSIASYYIKTVVLWMVEEQDATFWNNSQSYVFMTALETYHRFLEEQYLPYYWNPSCNLIGDEDPDTLRNISNKILGVINDVERNVHNDAFVLVKYLVIYTATCKDVRPLFVHDPSSKELNQSLKIQFTASRTAAVRQKAKNLPASRTTAVRQGAKNLPASRTTAVRREAKSYQLPEPQPFVKKPKTYQPPEPQSLVEE